MMRDDGVLGECDVTVSKGNLLYSLFKDFYTIKQIKWVIYLYVVSLVFNDEVKSTLYCVRSVMVLLHTDHSCTLF